MASVRAGRRQVVLPGPGQGGKSLSVLVMMLVAVLAAIALIWSFSRRAPPAANVPLGSAEPAAAPTLAPPPRPAADPEPALAATPALAEDERDDVTAPSQRKIVRVIDGGRDGLKHCYQRALVRDDTLVHGRMNVRLSIAPSGRVDTVRVTGPEAFHSVQACLERTTARWTFPAASEPYAAEFPLVLQGAL